MLLVLLFVGRRAELEALRRYNARQMPMPIFVYGPEGCGKSRLFERPCAALRSGTRTAKRF